METVKLGLLIKKTKVARCGEHSYPVLSITKQDGIIMQSEKFKKRIASADTSDYKIIPRGKLVQGIHIDEGNFGIQDIVDNGIVSPAYGVWDVNDGLVIPKYLEMVLRSPKSIEFYRSKLTGTVNRRGHMSDADFLSMDIPLPDRDTQSKILKTMKQTTSVLYSRQQQLAKLDELIKARFVEMFGDPISNPFGFKVKTLQKMIDDGTIMYHLDGNHGSDYPRNEEFVECGVPYISANCIVHNDVNLKLAKHLTEERASKLRKGIAQNGDVLFAHNATVGPVAILYTDDEKVILGTSLTAYRCDKERMVPDYLKAYMQSEGFVCQYTKDMKQTTRNQVPITAQRKFLFVIPPLSLQNQFAAFAAEVDKSKVEVQKALDQTQLLFDSLMQQYFG